MCVVQGIVQGIVAVGNKKRTDTPSPLGFLMKASVGDSGIRCINSLKPVAPIRDYIVCSLNKTLTYYHLTLCYLLKEISGSSTAKCCHLVVGRKHTVFFFFRAPPQKMAATSRNLVDESCENEPKQYNVPGRKTKTTS